MAMIINTNVSSLTAQRNLTKSQMDVSKAIQRLSSGLRINSAKDDAAGLAVSNRMTSQIRGTNMAIRNANDAISLAQTAEGALAESTNILQRIRELAVQASSDGATSSDRATMQVEVDALVAELDRIANKTTFNGRVLLDGSFSSAKYQVGNDAGDTVSMTMGNMKASALGGTSGTSAGAYTMAKEQNTAGAFTTSDSLAALNSADLKLNGIEIGAALSGDDIYSTTDADGSGLSIAAAINRLSGTTNVHAYAEKTTITLNLVSGAATGSTAAGELVINGVSVGAVAFVGSVVDTSGANLATAINAVAAGVDAVYTAGSNTMKLTAVDGRNIQFATNTGAEYNATITEITANTSDVVVRGQVSLYSSAAFTIAGNNPTATGFSAGTVSLDEKLFTNTATAFENLVAGDLLINGYSVRAPTTAGDADGASQSAVDPAASAKAIAYAINNTDTLKDQVTATAYTVANLGTVSAYAAAATDFVIEVNGVAVTFNQTITANDGSGHMQAALNTVFNASASGAATYGLVASMNSDNELLITSSAGVNIDLNVTTAADSSILSKIDISTTDTDVVSKGSVSLAAKTGYSISSIEGGKQSLAGISSSVGTISNASVATFDSAQTVLSTVNSALTQIDDLRASLGAVQNRFESTISNLGNIAENLAAARSRVLDADFATETANLTKAQILQQAGVAMLSQANQLPQTILSLLG